MIDWTQLKTAEDQTAEALESYQKGVVAAIDTYVDNTAKDRGYNSAAHLASYVTSSVSQWAEEATKFVLWRDAVWLAAISIQQTAVESGVFPSVDDVVSSLPKVNW